MSIQQELERAHYEIAELTDDNIRLGKLVAAQQEYIDELCKELNETVSLASIHGWKSSRYEKGVELRAKIDALKR